MKKRLVCLGISRKGEKFKIIVIPKLTLRKVSCNNKWVYWS